MLIGERHGSSDVGEHVGIYCLPCETDMLESEYTVVSNISRHGVPPVGGGRTYCGSDRTDPGKEKKRRRIFKSRIKTWLRRSTGGTSVLFFYRSSKTDKGGYVMEKNEGGQLGVLSD